MLIRLSEHMVPVKGLSKPLKGIVVDNEDPKKLGRVKCTIAGIMEADKEKLPWITSPYSPSKFDVPEINEELIIEFPYGNVYNPFFTGYWHNEANHDTLFDTDYPNSFGISKQGFILKYNKTLKKGEFIHPSGTTATLLEDGTLQINIAKDLALVISGKVTQSVTGDIEFSSDGNLKLIGKGGVEVTSDGSAKFAGKGSTEVGDGGSSTEVKGTSILLAGGGLGVALLTSQTIAVGNLGAPVVGNIIEGSSKVFAPK